MSLATPELCAAHPKRTKPHEFFRRRENASILSVPTMQQSQLVLGDARATFTMTDFGWR
jgi:hypothetical protein